MKRFIFGAIPFFAPLALLLAISTFVSLVHGHVHYDAAIGAAIGLLVGTYVTAYACDPGRVLRMFSMEREKDE